MRSAKLISAALLLLSFLLLGASQTRADAINYVYTSSGITYTWTLPTNPVIDPANVYPGLGFTIPDWSFSESTNPNPMVGTFDFFNSSIGGGFDLKTGGGTLINAYGLQLYTGPESAPTMLVGAFSTFLDYGSDTSGSSPPSSGNSLQSTSVPEPSTLSLLTIGLA